MKHHLMQNQALKYRPDIDGIRAIAVAAIVLYHAGFNFFRGGFVGVDIFFVISGFLITGQIIASVEAGRFSFGSFYERRIRRLMPAALFTFLCVSVASYFILIPEQLSDFGSSLIASILWASNFFFWQSTGYFDLDAHTKPLLHIWSLNVEEQFYLIWPALIVLFARRSRPAVFLAVFVISAISLIACIGLRGEQAAVFYLMPFRIVEFGMGAMLAVPKSLPKPTAMLEASAILGLAILAAVIYFYTETMEFPGLSALPPCLGAMLLIYGGRAPCTGLLLRNRLSAWIGRISYSVYLLHWPIIVFFRLTNPGEIPIAAKFSVVVISIIGGAAMYRYIETPFRHGANPMILPARRLFYALIATVIALLVTPGIMMRVDNGWEWRYPLEIREQMKVNFDKEFAWTNLNRLNLPFTNAVGPKILIVGDSQAGDFLNMVLSAHGENGAEIRSEVIQGECQAVIPRSDAYYAALRAPYNEYCKRYHSTFLTSGKIEHADIAVLAASWQPFGIAELNNTVDYYLSHGVKKVFIVGRKDQGLSGQTLLQKFWNAHDIDEISARYRSNEAANINRLIRDQVKDATYINLMDEFCPASNSCRVMTPDRKIIFSDVMHLTEPGTKFMATILKKDGAFSLVGEGDTQSEN